MRGSGPPGRRCTADEVPVAGPPSPHMCNAWVECTSTGGRPRTASRGPWRIRGWCGLPAALRVAAGSTLRLAGIALQRLRRPAPGRPAGPVRAPGSPPRPRSPNDTTGPLRAGARDSAKPLPCTAAALEAPWPNCDASWASAPRAAPAASPGSDSRPGLHPAARWTDTASRSERRALDAAGILRTLDTPWHCHARLKVGRATARGVMSRTSPMPVRGLTTRGREPTGDPGRRHPHDPDCP